MHYANEVIGQYRKHHPVLQIHPPQKLDFMLFGGVRLSYCEVPQLHKRVIREPD